MTVHWLSSAAFAVRIVKVLAISALIAAVRVAIDPLVGEYHQFVPAYIGVAAATWFVGWPGGAFAAAVGLAADIATTPAPHGDGYDAIAYMGYFAMCVLLVSSIEWIKSERAESAALAADLRQADQRKSDFIAMLGHELRNPLSTISMATSLLRTGALAGVVARDSTWNVLERQTEQMSKLVGDLLDISRIEKGKLTLHRELVSVAAVVEEAIGDILSRTSAKRQRVTHTLSKEGGLIFVDRMRLEQVLVNLLHNASKFSGEESVIAVTTKAGPEWVEISVKDNGAGIEKEQLEAIFGSFVQADSTRGQHGGLGLGLALARTLTELHEGTLVARSDGPGTGAEFILKLPRAIPEESAKATLSVHAANEASLLDTQRAPLRLLIVDDNSDAAYTLALLLRERGHVTFTADSGKNAIEIAAREQPDVAFIDIGLPDMSGLQVAKEMRRGVARQPMLVALTGWAGDQDRRRSKAAGFDLHLSKPVTVPEIDSALDACIHQEGTPLLPRAA